ncbi:MAG: copper oxidase [Microbacterium sp. 14-71-5]|nr:MAG: copper oxidase [Microbacterium sp. 14-71-5]
MRDLSRPTGPRQLPGSEGTTTSRAAMAVVGVVIVVGVALAVLLARPSTGLSGGGAAVTSVGTTGGTTRAATTTVTPTGRTTEVTLRVSGTSFTPSTVQVPVGDRLRITVVNSGDQRHDLVLADASALGPLAPGATATLDAGVIGADLEGWCSLPGHRQLGMVLHVVPVGAPGLAASGSSSGASSGSATQGTGGTAAAASGTTTAPTMADLQAEAAALPAYPAQLPPLDSSTDRSYTFTITQQQDPVTAGLTREVWTYNGTTPGPILHGRVGDTFRITLVNNGAMGHSIDFHAGETAPDEPMRTIEPGQSLEYTFTADRAGIWMYHCETVPMSSHIANGLFGAVVIEPDGLPPVDRSYVVVQSDLYLGADGRPADATKIAGLVPDVVAFNGRAFQYDAHPLTATVGQRVRLWVLDAGPNSALSFHVVGTQFDTVWTEGAYRVYRGAATDGTTRGSTGAQLLPLLPGEGGFVELVPQQPGRYSLVNHQMSLAEKGAHGVLQVTG